jgi:hypothetical protein
VSFLSELKEEADCVIAALTDAGVDQERLKFGGARTLPERVFVPSFADSKFQAEQALGDWAEACLASAINGSDLPIKAIHYGFSSKIVAGEEGFKEQYLAGLEDTYQNGKRADLLLLPNGVVCADDISSVATLETKELVEKALGAIEVRSSRLEVEKYIAYKKMKDAAGAKKDPNPTPNFTVKVEDLIIVYRWMEFFQKPQAYAQVFLDSVYGISFRNILRYIASAQKLRLETPARSRKITIMIPITNGERIGTVSEYPKFEVVDRLTANGRHDIYAKPSGGRITLDGEKIVALFG